MPLTDTPNKHGPLKTFALGALFWLPLLSGVVDKLFERRKWFGDYNAIACAAEKHLLGEPMYARDLACPDINVVMYIYNPWVAEGFSYVLAALGRDGMFGAYLALYAAALVAFAWLIVGRRSPAPRSKRAWFAAFLTGSAIYWANIGIVLQGLIGFVAITFRKHPLLLILPIAAAMFVKPLFGGFAMVFLLMRRPLLTRLGYALAALALGAAPTLWLLWQGGELVEQWRALMEFAVYEEGQSRGDGYLGWLWALGVDITSTGAKIGFLGFAGLIAAAGVVLAEGLELDDEARVLLGLSLGVLLNPRIMAQDFWLLGPGLLAMTAAVSARGRGAGRLLERALLGLCVLALVGNLADLADYHSTRIAMAGLALAVLCAAAWTLTAGRANIALMWANLLRGG